MAVSRTSWKPGYRPPGAIDGKPGPRLPLDVRRLKDQAKAEAIKAIAECLLMDRTQIANMMADPQSTMVQLITGSVISQALKQGDMNRFALLLNYVMGKPKPLTSSWHDDVPESEREADNREAIKRVPTELLLQAMKAQTDAKSES